MGNDAKPTHSIPYHTSPVSMCYLNHLAKKEKDDVTSAFILQSTEDINITSVNRSSSIQFQVIKFWERNWELSILHHLLPLFIPSPNTQLDLKYHFNPASKNIPRRQDTALSTRVDTRSTRTPVALGLQISPDLMYTCITYTL